VIIGTAHISDESASDVRKAIRMLQPQQVLIELCSSRVAITNPEHIARIYRARQAKLDAQLQAGASSATDGNTAVHQRVPNQDGIGQSVAASTSEQLPEEAQEEPEDLIETKDETEDQSLLEALKGAMGKQGGIMAVAIGYMYKSISKQVKLNVGDDMRTAAEEAARAGSRIILGDRPIGITLARAWSGLSTWQKLKLGYELLKVSFSSIKTEDLEQLKNKDILTDLIQELGLHYPSLAIHLLHERDLYLAHKLRQCPGPVTVGVVGLGHVEGIRKHWKSEIDIASIMVQPPSSSWKSFFLKIILGFGLFIGLIVFILYKFVF
jgi:pheromone shutdown protein TraB